MNVIYLLLNILLVSALVYPLWCRQTEPFLKLAFWPALFLKLSCGLLLGWLYQHYYGGGDTFVYQRQADILSQYARINFSNYLHFIFTGEYESVYLYDVMKYRGYSNSFFMVLLLHFLNFITGNQYYLNSIFFSLFSFYGCWCLTETLTQVFPSTKFAAAGAFLFYPTAVFWSSGILKESILLGSTTLVLAQVLQLVYLPSSTIRQWAILFIGAYFCFKIRFYFAIGLFPLLAGFAVLEVASRRWKISQHYKISFYLIALLVFGFGATFLHEAVNLDYFFQELIKSYYGSRMSSAQKSIIYLPNLQPTFQSLLYYAPEAISSAIFRPLPGEINSPDYFMAGFENLIVLILAGVGVVTFRKHKPILPVTLVLSLMIYVILIAALIGFSTANLGSVSRYKVAFMPVFLYLLLQTGVNQKITTILEKWLSHLHNLPAK